MRRAFVATLGIVALLLGIVILVRGITEHASLLYDVFGVLFLGLGAARIYELRRGGR
ncbi:MAG: hypothetical protein M0Z66_13375 [Thermaerobacter sp.]|nr:hypothetical protein [Thermaerobacter sp.]